MDAKQKINAEAQRSQEERFNKWFAEFVDLAKKAEWPVGDPQIWMCYFDEGYMPRQALNDEISYGRE
jgi:hypothetical protein